MNRRSALAGIGGGLALGACGAFDRIPIRPPDAPYVTTREDIVLGMLTLAKVGPDDMVYDLGCGDGRIPIMAAQKFGARGLGVEIDPVLVRLGQDNAARAGVADRVQFRLEDLFKTDVRPATVVALYLLPEMMEKLKFTLRAQLRPGARVVSHEFLWGGDWLPDRSERVGTTTIHLWQVPK
jgi:SAM-dependent methyltransferase